MTTQAILFMQKFGYGMTGLVLTQRTYRIFLIVFIGDGVRLEMELELAWLLPVPFLNCRTEP